MTKKSKGEAAVMIFRRRRAGSDESIDNARRNLVKITLESLECYFNGPLVNAASNLGICATALKKVCRKLGVEKWPYKDNKPVIKKERSWPGPVNSLSSGCSGEGRLQPDLRKLCNSSSEEDKGFVYPGGPTSPRLCEDITIYPRSARTGVNSEGAKTPVTITYKLLTDCFDMPLHAAADHLGICITAFKKVCRRFGIQKWPYRESLQSKIEARLANSVKMENETRTTKIVEMDVEDGAWRLASLADAAWLEDRKRRQEEEEALRQKKQEGFSALLVVSQSILG